MVRYMNLEEQVDKDFTHARRRALLPRMKARFRKDLTCNRLLSFDEVKGSLGPFNEVYLGISVVPVEKIVGSVNRYRDFTEMIDAGVIEIRSQLPIGQILKRECKEI